MTRPSGEGTGTFWNGEPCQADRCRVIVGDVGDMPLHWARDLVGTERAAVLVVYYSQHFLLDDEDGSGWAKVTEGRGSPRWPHRNLPMSSKVLPRGGASCLQGEGEK